MSKVILLGPQRFEPTVAEVLDSLQLPEGPVAVVTAGWQEREPEIDELRDHVHRDALNLALYNRYENVLQHDHDLANALSDRQSQLRRVQQIYRRQLANVLGSARELVEMDDGPWVEEHRREGIRLVKTLDRHHLNRIRGIHESFGETWRPAERDSVRGHRDDLGAKLAGCRALLVAGGHVATLLNRMRLFELGPLIHCPVIAWSAGAMAIGDRVVLFHDHPPQGPGDAEILETGFGWHQNLIPLPHADRRLALGNKGRVSLFARRVSPAKAVILDGRTRLDWDGEGWHAPWGFRRLTRAGRVMEKHP